MRKIYRTIDDVLRSPWGAIKQQDEKAAATDRVLRSTRLEDSIYADLRDDDPDLDQIEQAARRFTITGILLDQEQAGMEFSLAEFCQNIYRTSELTGEEVVQAVIRSRV